MAPHHLKRSSNVGFTQLYVTRYSKKAWVLKLRAHKTGGRIRKRLACNRCSTHPH